MAQGGAQVRKRGILIDADDSTGNDRASGWYQLTMICTHLRSATLFFVLLVMLGGSGEKMYGVTS